ILKAPRFRLITSAIALPDPIPARRITFWNRRRSAQSVGVRFWKRPSLSLRDSSSHDTEIGERQIDGARTLTGALSPTDDDDGELNLPYPDFPISSLMTSSNWRASPGDGGCRD